MSLGSMWKTDDEIDLARGIKSWFGNPSPVTGGEFLVAVSNRSLTRYFLDVFGSSDTMPKAVRDFWPEGDPKHGLAASQLWLQVQGYDCARSVHFTEWTPLGFWAECKIKAREFAARALAAIYLYSEQHDFTDTKGVHLADRVPWIIAQREAQKRHLYRLLMMAEAAVEASFGKAKVCGPYWASGYLSRAEYPVLKGYKGKRGVGYMIDAPSFDSTRYHQRYYIVRR